MLPQADVPSPACGPVKDDERLPSHFSPRILSVSYRCDTLARVAVATAPGRAARPLPPECLVVASHGRRVCGDRSCHSMVPSARCAHHSMASSGTRMRQRKTARLRGYRRGGGTGRQHGGHGICLPMKSSPVRSARFAGRSSRADHAASRTIVTNLLCVRVRKACVRRSFSLR